MTQEEMYRHIFSSARVSEETSHKILLASEQTVPRRAPSRLLKTSLITAAVLMLLAATAFAATGLRFGELSESVMRWLNIADTPVPQYISYDSVTVAEGADTADSDHRAAGELYLNIHQSVRSENLFVVTMSSTTVSSAQLEDYVWRLQIDGGDFVPIEFAKDERGNGPLYPRYGAASQLGSLFFRAAFITSPETAETLRVRLCAGTESADGKSFEIIRVSAYSELEIKKAAPTVTIELGNDVSYENSVTGETGYITAVEISSKRLIWHYLCPGGYELYDRVYIQPGYYTGDEWLERNEELMGWCNGAVPLSQGASLNLSDGSSLCGFLEASSLWCEDDTAAGFCDIRQTIDTEKIESITVGGKTFYR